MSFLMIFQKHKLFKPVEFQTIVLFKPNKHYVAQLEEKDYLGKAKVILMLGLDFALVKNCTTLFPIVYVLAVLVVTYIT